MPLVHIDLIEGRSEERIHIVLNEMRPDRYSVAGKMASDK